MSFVLQNWTIDDLMKNEGAGSPSTVDALARVDALEDALRPHGNEDAVAAILQATKALRGAFPLVTSALKNACRRFFDASRAMQTARGVAAKTVDEQARAKNQDHRTRNQALLTADRSVNAAFWVQVVIDTQDEMQKNADDLAKRINEKCSDARREVDAALALWRGPQALRDRGDFLERASQVSLLREEIELFKPTALLRMYEGIVASGDDARAELFERACEPILAKLAGLAIKDLAKRLELPVPAQRDVSGIAYQEQAAIGRLRRAMYSEQAKRVPEWVSILEPAMSQLVGIYSLLLGYHASRLDRATYEGFWLKGTAPDPWTTHPQWLRLALPTNPPAFR